MVIGSPVERLWRYANCKVSSVEGRRVWMYNPKSEKVGTVWKTQIKKESSDF